MSDADNDMAAMNDEVENLQVPTLAIAIVFLWKRKCVHQRINYYSLHPEEVSLRKQ